MSNNVRKLRYRFHMTQRDFAEKCGISICSISRYEAGVTPSRINAEKIAMTCNVSIDYVLCKAYDPAGKTISSITQEEMELIDNYCGLTAKGKLRARAYLCELMALYPDTK